ncbi:MAG: hypothetical protein ACI8WB_000372 [Phenylobacterium sp.]|jgi:hypothetical protein
MMSPQQISVLQQIIGGTVLVPGEVGYAQATIIDNGRIRRTPDAIVIPIDDQDVLNSLTFARAENIPFTIKGGGHSATGYCLNDQGLVISMSAMKKLELDTKTGILQMDGGKTWSEVYDYLKEYGEGWVPVGGACSTVGVSGFILGGGISFVSRSCGLSVDNLLSVTLVTAERGTVTVAADSAEAWQRDLFWACQGGGGGNYGVATSFTIQLHKTKGHCDKILGGMFYYPLDQAESIMAEFNIWVQTIPDELAVYGFMGYYGDTNIPVVRLEPVYNGDYETGRALIQPLFDWQPIEHELYDTSLLDFETIVGGTTLVQSRSAYITSAMVPEGGLTTEVMTLFKEAIRAAPSIQSYILWVHVGGKVNEVDAAATAYVHRNTQFVFELKAIWDTLDEMLANVNWARALTDGLCTLLVADEPSVDPDQPGAYVNYIDPLLANWTGQYYGSNYPRLEAIKDKEDPHNVFNFQQGIGSDFNPKEGVYSPLNRVFVYPMGN